MIFFLLAFTGIFILTQIVFSLMRKNADVISNFVYGFIFSFITGALLSANPWAFLMLIVSAIIVVLGMIVFYALAAAIYWWYAVFPKRKEK